MKKKNILFNKMSDLEKNMVNLKQWIEVDIKSPTTRQILTNRINFHIDHPDLFSPTLYDKNKQMMIIYFTAIFLSI